MSGRNFLFLALAAWGLLACFAESDESQIPAQPFANLLELRGANTGELFGQIQFPSEYTQHSVTFQLRGRRFVTNPDGRFLISQIPVGTHPLEVHLEGFESVQQQVTVTEGQTARLPLELRPARGRVYGRLVDPDGRSAEGIALRLAPYRGVTTTDSDGIFQFMGVSSGEHTLTLANQRYFIKARYLKLDPHEQRNLGIIPVYPLDNQRVRASLR